MKKFWMIVIVIAVIVLGWWVMKQRAMPTNIILFSRAGCPHCEEVEKFLQNNPAIEKKIQLEKRSVDNKPENVKLLLKATDKCGIDTQQVGLPFLWTGKTCILGAVEIINFFNAQKK